MTSFGSEQQVQVQVQVCVCVCVYSLISRREQVALASVSVIHLENLVFTCTPAAQNTTVESCPEECGALERPA